MKTILFLVAGFIAICTFNCTAQQAIWKGNTAIYRGNKVIFSPQKRDTVTTTDKATGEEIQQVRVADPSPLTVNGRKIYDSKELASEPQNTTLKTPFAEYIFTGLSSSFKSLPDGAYEFNLYPVIIDNNGKIVFYDFRTFYGYDKKNKRIRIDELLYKIIAAKLDELINNAPKFAPGKAGGKNVVAILDDELYKYKIEVNEKSVKFNKKH